MYSLTNNESLTFRKWKEYIARNVVRSVNLENFCLKHVYKKLPKQNMSEIVRNRRLEVQYTAYLLHRMLSENFQCLKTLAGWNNGIFSAMSVECLYLKKNIVV